jgi:catechol 2,3-dioxygenase-like lactoylglutathione lyase family enzyme
MLDHIFLSVSDIDRSVDFYTATLAPLGITARLDYDGRNGPPGHLLDPDGYSLEFVFKPWQHSA